MSVIGAIIGDIVGSRFEFNNYRKKDFEFFSDDCYFTDDTVMTLAVAKASFLSFILFAKTIPIQISAGIASASQTIRIIL